MIGILMVFVSLAIFNGLAYLFGLLAKEMLGKKRKR